MTQFNPYVLRLYFSPIGMEVRKIRYYTQAAAKAASTKFLKLLGTEHFHTTITFDSWSDK